MKVYYLTSINGKHEYKRNARTKKEFIKSLIDEGVKDFRNFTFERYDFSGLDLSDCDFNGSELSNCRFVASQLSGAKFNNVFVEESDFSNSFTYRKMQANNSCFIDNDMYKAKWMNSDIINSELTRNNFERGSLTNSNLEGSTLNNNSFKNSKLSRIFKDYSKWVKNNLDGADFSSNMLESINIRAHSDNYAVFVGNKVSKKTIYDKNNNKILKSDIKFNKLFDLLSNTAIAATLGIAAYYLSSTAIGTHLISELGNQINGIVGDFSSLVGGGAAAVFTISAANFLRGEITEYIENKLSEPLKEKIIDSAIKIRSAINVLPKKFMDYSSLLIAFGDHRTLAPIIKAMESRELKEKRSNGNLFAKYFLNPKEESFIICDKKHLAEALSYMSQNRDKGYSLQRDIIILKGDSSKSNIPSAVRFHKNNMTTVLWDDENGQTKYGVIYDKNGNPENIFDYQLGIQNVDIKEVPNSETMIKALDTLERYVLNKNGLTDFSYDSQKNIIRHGNKGEIITERKSTGKIDNNYDGEISPAILKPTQTGWEREYYIDGKEIINPFRDLHELEEFTKAEAEIDTVRKLINENNINDNLEEKKSFVM